MSQGKNSIENIESKGNASQTDAVDQAPTVAAGAQTVLPEDSKSEDEVIMTSSRHS